MARALRTHLQRRRNQRWLRQEALLLAREAELFDCPAMRHEAKALLAVTS